MNVANDLAISLHTGYHFKYDFSFKQMSRKLVMEYISWRYSIAPIDLSYHNLSRHLFTKIKMDTGSQHTFMQAMHR